MMPITNSQCQFRTYSKLSYSKKVQINSEVNIGCFTKITQIFSTMDFAQYISIL